MRQMVKRGMMGVGLSSLFACFVGVTGCGSVDDSATAASDAIAASDVLFDTSIAELLGASNVQEALDELATDGKDARDRLGGLEMDMVSANTRLDDTETGLVELREDFEAHKAEFRTIARVSGRGNDDLDAGKLESRVLHFTKKHPDTGLRVSYVDVFRVQGSNQACTWEIRFNDRSCDPDAIRFDKYVAAESGAVLVDDHDPNTVFGTCFGVPAGSVTVDVWVIHAHGAQRGDCHTGWNNSSWALEVEEVW